MACITTQGARVTTIALPWTRSELQLELFVTLHDGVWQSNLTRSAAALGPSLSHCGHDWVCGLRVPHADKTLLALKRPPLQKIVERRTALRAVPRTPSPPKHKVALVLRSHGANLLELAWIKRGNFVIVITSESAAAIPQLEPADGSRLLDRPHRGCGPNQAPQSLRQVADRERECWRARRWGWRR